MFSRKRRVRPVREIAPDEIFLDASNLPDFDQSRLEGKLERPIARRTFVLLGGSVFLILLTLVTQAANLQLIQGKVFAEQSERNRLRPEVIFAPRGAIVDRNGVPLVYNEGTDTGFVRRIYRTPGFAHLLGYVSYPKKDSSGNFYDTEIKGLAGVEKVFNDRLAGRNGTLLVEEDALGEVHSQGSVVAPLDGETITLAVDARAQEAFAAAVADLADRIPFQGGSAILMDVETGEVHALVSYPEYDPNILSQGQPAEVIGRYARDARQPYLDRAISGLYTPGSIVKPMEAAGAHHDGLISAEKTIVSNGFISIPNPYDASKPTIFNDWKAHGATDMREAIAVSSDVYFYAIGGGYGDQKGLGIARLKHWYDTFGFTTPTGIELEGEATGFVPTPEWKEEVYGEPWRIGNTYHTAIGQFDMRVTVTGAVRATAAIANNGKLVRPTVVKGKPLEGQTININRESLRIAREGMRMAVTTGTATGLNSLSFTSVAAKTGTAQLGFNNEFYNMWAVGFFPYEKPKYAFAVVMEKGPAGTATGGIYVVHQALSKLHQTAPEYFDSSVY